MLLLFIGQTISAQCPGPVGDCDGDEVLDYLDLDDNNNGILDTVECPITFIDFLPLQEQASPRDSPVVFDKFLNGDNLPPNYHRCPSSSGRDRWIGLYFIKEWRELNSI